MNKELFKYLSNEINVVKVEVIISREKTNNGQEYIHITTDGLEDYIYKFWVSSNKNNENPKHTGGKKSYTKIMSEYLDEHPELSLEASGLLFKLSNKIMWNNNLIVNKRTKKPLNIEDICKLVNKSKPTVIKVMDELKQLGLLIHDNDGYKISNVIMQKGGAKK